MHEIPIEMVTRRSGASLTRGNSSLLAFAPQAGPGVRAARRRSTASRSRAAEPGVINQGEKNPQVIQSVEQRARQPAAPPSSWHASASASAYVFAHRLRRTQKRDRKNRRTQET
jgi:hypothetical protein